MPTARPQAAKPTPAQEVAKLAAQALSGTLTLSFAQGMALTKTFQQLAAHPLDSAAMAAHFADTLVAIHPALAGHVVDALAERVGR